jgi:hypothetical protein
MVRELHTCTEAKPGRSPIQKEDNKVYKEIAKAQDRFAIDAKKEGEE